MKRSLAIFSAAPLTALILAACDSSAETPVTVSSESSSTHSSEPNSDRSSDPSIAATSEQNWSHKAVQLPEKSARPTATFA